MPGLLAFVFGWFAFRSRVNGVYLSIITQAMTYALLLAFFRNDMGFGGNNGMTDFKDILGFNVQADGTRASLFAATAIFLALSLMIASAIVRSKFGKVLVGVRDAESRTRFLGYRVEHFKLFTFVVSAMMAGIAGALMCRRSASSIPANSAPANSIEVVIWTAVGRRGDADRADHRRHPRQWRQDVLHRRSFLNYWLSALGGLFVLVTLFLPKGIVGTIAQYLGKRKPVSTACRRRRPKKRALDAKIQAAE